MLLLLLIIIAIILALAAWLACGYVAGALWFTYFQRNWPTLAAGDLSEDRRKAYLTMLGGLLALIAMLLARTYKHGIIWNWMHSE